MKVVVTGISGWLGGSLAAKLAAAGHEVFGLSRRETCIDGVRWVRLDIAGEDDTVKAFFEAFGPFDVCVHLAGALGWCDMEQALDVNVAGTRRVVEAALANGAVRKFVVASSVAAISTSAPDRPPRELPMPADHPCVMGPWPYGMSKAHVEDVLRVMTAGRSCDVLCVRIGNTVTDPPDIVHHDGKGIKYPVPPATTKDPAATFPEATLCSVALSDQIRCLELAALAPYIQARFDVIACVAPQAYTAEPISTLFRAWYGDAADTIKGLDLYEKKGNERMPIYDLSPARDLIGWVPEVDLTVGVPLVAHGMVFLDIEKKVEADKVEEWLCMAAKLASHTRREDGCISYNFIRVVGTNTTFRIVENWRDEIALEAHVASKHFRKFVPAMDAISLTTQFHKCVDALDVERPISTNGHHCPHEDKTSGVGVNVNGKKSQIDSDGPGRRGKILVLYDSASSCTKCMAKLVADGCLLLDRTEVRLRAVPGDENHWDCPAKLDCGGRDVEAQFEDILWADGIACGSPTNLGCVSWRMKKFWDDFSQAGYWGRCDGKLGCAFSSVGGTNGGGELVCQAMCNILMNFGFATFGITDYVTHINTLHYGAVCAKAPRDEVDKMCCRRLGLRLAEFVGYYIVHRLETHPLLSSKKLDAAAWGSPIPPRSAPGAHLLARNTARACVDDSRPTCLIFTNMVDYVHDSTPAAAAYIARLAIGRGYRPIVSASRDALDRIKNVGKSSPAVVVLVNISGDAFDVATESLTEHLDAGKPILGVHAALASFLNGRDAEGRTELETTTGIISEIFGCHFKNHPPPQAGTCILDSTTIRHAFGGDFANSAIDNLPSLVSVHDEFFNYTRSVRSDPHTSVLASLDENTYNGGTMGSDHPIVWAKAVPGKGRIFYCGLGHFDHQYDGINFARNNPDADNLSRQLVARFLDAGWAWVAPDPIRFAMTDPDYYAPDSTTYCGVLP